MSNQFEKKEDGPKPPPQHMYARRPAPVVSQTPNLVPLMHPVSAAFRDNTPERTSIPSSTSVAMSATRFGMPGFNRPPPAIPPPGSSISQPLCMPMPQPVMQVSDTLTQPHHLSSQGIHAGVNPQQVLASGLLGQLSSLQQLPASSQPQMQAQQQQQSQFQRLKVEDALSYLDQVKFQFGNQPQVYNDFLDIMKEFKSQSIDTPGVIARVSSLFAGHADLIVGFNTFLPPGYKIEVSGNDQVSVTGPNMLPQTINTQHGGNGPAAAIQVHTPQTKYVSPQSQGSQNQASHLTSQPGHAPTPPGSMFTPSGHPTQPVLSGANATNVLPPTTHSSAAPSGMPVANAALGSAIPQSQVVGQQPQVGSQPVEFNHAINYVNKIKHRFQGQTDIYKAFLEILHKYQKEQRTVKETNGAYTPSLSESEVYSQVAKLFKDDEDLLKEFGQFLPDAGGGMGSSGNLSALTGGTTAAIKQENTNIGDHHSKKATQHSSSSSQSSSSSSASSKTSRPSNQSLKRSSALAPVQGKKVRSCSLKDVSLAEASKHGTLGEFGFFDKVRRALGSQEVYDNFLRCLLLYNNEVIGRGELVQLVQPFLMKFPELFSWFKRFLGYKEGQTGENWSNSTGLSSSQSQTLQTKEKHEGMAMEIDYTTLKRLGSSYRALPVSYDQPKCTGRDALCKEVLNDTWVSFPSWSEESQSVTSKKTQFEEHVYRCEDERFELDVVLETNNATILVLEAVNKDLTRMSDEEKAKFKLDNCLGGTSEVIHRKAIHRIYGDKAPDIIDGLKKNPAVAVPVVLKRLKMKDEEWKEAQHQFNKIWREQNEKYYLKSLDHQGINFKQNDIRFLRSKSLINEIENMFDERQEALEAGTNTVPLQGPHMTLTYEDKSMMDDCASLIIHHVKRQSSIHKDDKQKMKVFMYQTLPDLFFSPRGNQPSDDDDDEDEDSESDSKSSSSRSGSRNGKSSVSKPKPKSKITGGYSLNDDLDGMYHHFVCNNSFYLFFRLHEILCARLLKIYRRAEILAEEDAKEKKESGGKESVASMLRLKQVSDIEVIEYYPAFMEMVRNLLDGNIDSSQYEDQLRDMFTIHAYIVFTMDKLVTNIVRQLQHIIQDELCSQLLQCYLDEEKNNATGGQLLSAAKRQQPELNYQRKVEQLIAEDNSFKILVKQKKSQLHVDIELIDSEEDQEEVAELADTAKWSDYVEKYVGELQDEIPNDVKEKILKAPPVFMQRNAATHRRLKKRESDDEDCKDSDKEKKNMNKKKKLYCYGEMEVTFNRNSYKMTFVPGTGFTLYRQDTLQRAKEGQNKRNKALHDKLQAKVSEWGRENVSRDMSRQCTNWLMGKVPGQGGSMEDLSNCTTICKAEKVGMVTRNRYMVEHHKETKSSVNA